jgi:Fur family ferric uptake transcriptional regulator
MKNPHVAFEQYLTSHNGRYTPQKQAILDAICKTRRHFEVEDFIDQFRAKNNKLSRATVYRTIKQLLDAGLLQKITTLDGKVYYERSTDDVQHDHLICKMCGSITEIQEPIIDQYLQKFCDAKAFTPEYRSLHIYGICKKCRGKK